MGTRIDNLEDKIYELSEKLEQIKNKCLSYCKAELLINDRALGKSELADEILEIIKIKGE